LVAVSVDLDAVECYFRIHGLAGEPDGQTRFAILRRCLPRLLDLFARHSVPATFFVVGRDLDEDPEGRRLLRDLASAGHELANHSYGHPYDLVRLGRARIEEEIHRAHAAVGDIAGQAPVGFRAPGYEISREVLDHLEDLKYRYDSSVFPSIPYYVAKAAVMGAMRILGRRSGSILGSAAVLRAPRGVYRPSATCPYRKGDRAILEVPMAVTPWLRLPVIGTTIVTAPNWVRRRLVAAALRQPLCNLELHGIDAADAGADGLPPALVARQPDLRVSLQRKLHALDETLAQARAAGGTFCTLRDAITRMGKGPVSIT
jgi:peptidoglycan/xylan/chitin deacetylase (PgdA/CDA1 family)